MGCHNKVPHTWWLKQQKFIFPGSRGWKFEIKVLVRWASRERSLPGLQMVALFLHVQIIFPLSICMEREWSFWYLFFKAHWSYQSRTPLSRPHLTLTASLEAPSPNTYWGVGLQHISLGRDRIIQSILISIGIEDCILLLFFIFKKTWWHYIGFLTSTYFSLKKYLNDW